MVGIFGGGMMVIEKWVNCLKIMLGVICLYDRWFEYDRWEGEGGGYFLVW